jgi:hypothetical protein
MDSPKRRNARLTQKPQPRLGHATARRVAWLPDTAPRLPAETRALANAGLPDTNAGADGARPTGHPEADVGGGRRLAPGHEIWQHPGSP